MRKVRTQQVNNSQNNGITDKIIDAADRTGVLDDLIDLGGDLIGGTLDALFGYFEKSMR